MPLLESADASAGKFTGKKHARTMGSAPSRAQARCLWVLTAGAAGVSASDWAACGESAEWSAFRRQVLAAQGDLSGESLAQKAQGLLKRWKVPATQWLSMLGSSRPVADSGNAVEKAHCGASVDITRGVLAKDTSRGFHPYHLLTLDKDSSAWKLEDFLRWRRDFCYLGYVVALYVRAAHRMVGQSGDEELSKIDLDTASSMLGRCRELDFLDRNTWGIHSLDTGLLLNLLRNLI